MLMKREDPDQTARCRLIKDFNVQFGHKDPSLMPRFKHSLAISLHQTEMPGDRKKTEITESQTRALSR